MSGLNVNLNGFAQLEARLQQIADVEATKAGQSAVSGGASLLKRKVVERAPRSDVPEGKVINRHRKNGSVRQEQHGKIVNQVKTKKARSEAGKVTSAVYVDKKAYHAFFVELGSIHNSPNPFMRSAIDNNAQAVVDQMGKVLKRQLIKRGV